jgi:Leucine Rich repeat
MNLPSSSARLRLALFMIMVVGCGPGHYALEEDKPKTAEEKAIAYLKSKGVGFEQIDPKFVRGVKEPYWRAMLGGGPVTKADLESLKQIKDLKHISIHGGHISDDELATIAELKQLTKLDVGDLPKVTDRGIDKIADIASLERLSLGPPQITDRAFKRFGRLRLKRLTLSALPKVTDRGIDYITDIATLEHLTLISLNVTDRAFRRFGRLKKLKSLELAPRHLKGALSVSDEALKFLKPLKQLEELFVRSPRVTDAGCAALTELPALKVLTLLNAKKITDAGCASLAAAPKLKELSLSGAAFGNQGVKALSKSKSLEVLFLGGTGIDDGAMKFIPDFKKLRRLTIWFKITDEGLKHLRKARLTSLNLYYANNEKITDRGLRYLQEMKTLKRLRLDSRGNGITERGLDRLRRARPDLALIIVRYKK